MDLSKRLQEFAITLHKIDAIKFGDFVTKSGLTTPVYCDLRVIISYPKVLEELSEIIIAQCNLNQKKEYDVLCGVPYTALPIATAVSLRTNIPMVMRRKEAKTYGTKKVIEGSYVENSSCLLIEDVVTSGGSVIETVNDLRTANIQCNNAVVILNREQGAEKALKIVGIQMHALFTLTQLIEILCDAEKIPASTFYQVKDYLNETQVPTSKISNHRLRMSYRNRAKIATNEIAQRLFSIMDAKKSNLCAAIDSADATEILNMAEQIGPYICILKTHIDIINDFHPTFVDRLQEIADLHNFLIMEDRKFADIGKTVNMQFTGGVYKPSTWASLVTSHSIMGDGTLEGLSHNEHNEQVDCGVFLLAEASSLGNLIDKNYTDRTVEMAVKYSRGIVVGVVCQNPLFLDRPQIIQLTPGVSLTSTRDNLGQRYTTPENAILQKGADVIVVGRAIKDNTDPVTAAKMHRDVAWASYQKRITL